jgi:hypothetical protein
MLIALPVFAISNPTTISFGTGSIAKYKCFYNVYETGDMLFMAEGNVYYATEPTDYTASQAFLYEVVNTSGNVTLLSKPLVAYGDRPIGIYQTAAQVTALGLTVGTAYGLRITGNPLIFSSSINNTITAYLSSGSYIDQSTSNATINMIKDFSIGVAKNIQANDIAKGIITSATPYYTTVQGVEYLTTLGGSLFLAGIPQLGTFCPSLFQANLASLAGDTTTGAGAYGDTLTPANQWNTLISNGLTNLGLYIRINQGMAGSVILFGLGIILAFYVQRRVESGIAAILVISTLPFAGAYLGLFPLALAFVIMFFLTLLMTWYFSTRGSL